MAIESIRMIINPKTALAPLRLAEMLKALYIRAINQTSMSIEKMIRMTARPISRGEMVTNNSDCIALAIINCENFSKAPEKPIKAPGKYGNLANACVPKMSIARIADGEAIRA